MVISGSIAFLKMVSLLVHLGPSLVITSSNIFAGIGMLGPHVLAESSSNISSHASVIFHVKIRSI